MLVVVTLDVKKAFIQLGGLETTYIEARGHDWRPHLSRCYCLKIFEQTNARAMAPMMDP